MDLVHPYCTILQLSKDCRCEWGFPSCPTVNDVLIGSSPRWQKTNQTRQNINRHKVKKRNIDISC